MNSFPAIRYLDLAMTCRMTSPGRLSAYKGSMLRGALGASLRKWLCMSRKSDCDACLLRGNCIFVRLFKPVQTEGKPLTPPFCIEPDLDSRQDYPEGERFNFNLKLFAYAVEHLPFFVQGFAAAGQKGLGSNLQPGQFVIEEITCASAAGQWVIFRQAEDRLQIPEPRIWRPQSLPSDLTRVELCLATPLRHKADSHFSSTLSFRELFQLILRRFKALALLEGDIWSLPPARFSELAHAADQIRIESGQLNWQDWTRYSSRQSTFMKLGGLTGAISYAGDLRPFADLLSFAAFAHVGKQSSFGLGKINLLSLN